MSDGGGVERWMGGEPELVIGEPVREHIRNALTLLDFGLEQQPGLTPDEWVIHIETVRAIRRRLKAALTQLDPAADDGTAF